MYVKFDMILLPFLYAAITWRRDDLRGWALRVAAVFIVVWGIWQWLMFVYPIEKPPGPPVDYMLVRLGDIFSDLKTFAVAWPPLLFLSLPLMLITLGWRRLPVFHRWSVGFVLGTLALYSVTVHMREVRAHVPLLCLLLPGALISLRGLLEEEEPTKPGAVASQQPLD